MQRRDQPESRRLPPTSDDLERDDAKPYFLWWLDCTVGDLRRALVDEDPERRAYFLGALLREANSRDVWLFTNPEHVREQWPRLVRHLGRTRAMWAWLLGLPEPEWPRRFHAIPLPDDRGEALCYMPAMVLAEPNRWSNSLPGQDDLPCSDGEPMETSFHVAQSALLVDSLLAAWPERHDFYIAGNMFVYFSEQQLRRNDFRGPDLFVVLDTHDKPRKSWVAWEEGGKLPNVVIEITSPSTEKIDRGEKMQIYSGIWRTPGYFILDPESLRVDGYRLDVDCRKYVPIAPDSNGDLPVPQLGLSLGFRRTRYRQFNQPFLRWIDAHGSPLLIADERAAAAEERAAVADERARAATERVRELENRLASIEPKG